MVTSSSSLITVVPTLSLDVIGNILNAAVLSLVANSTGNIDLNLILAHYFGYSACSIRMSVGYPVQTNPLTFDPCYSGRHHFTRHTCDRCYSDYPQLRHCHR